MYVAFMDVKKAFDRMKRIIMLNLLHKAGGSSLFINVVKAIYVKVRSCVGVTSELTEMF